MRPPGTLQGRVQNGRFASKVGFSSELEKCYSALEVLPCGKGLSVYSEPDGQTQSVFSFGPDFHSIGFQFPAPIFTPTIEKQLLKLHFPLGEPQSLN